MKTADKWGQNGKGEQWQEQWFEHYDSTGKAEKWADKWCSLDPNTPLDVGHAHVWHERWGETYDGSVEALNTLTSGLSSQRAMGGPSGVTSGTNT